MAQDDVGYRRFEIVGRIRISAKFLRKLFSLIVSLTV